MQKLDPDGASMVSGHEEHITPRPGKPGKSTRHGMIYAWKVVKRKGECRCDLVQVSKLSIRSDGVTCLVVMPDGRVVSVGDNLYMESVQTESETLRKKRKYKFRDDVTRTKVITNLGNDKFVTGNIGGELNPHAASRLLVKLV